MACVPATAATNATTDANTARRPRRLLRNPHPRPSTNSPMMPAPSSFSGAACGTEGGFSAGGPRNHARAAILRWLWSRVTERSGGWWLLGPRPRAHIARRRETLEIGAVHCNLPLGVTATHRSFRSCPVRCRCSYKQRRAIDVRRSDSERRRPPDYPVRGYRVSARRVDHESRVQGTRPGLSSTRQLFRDVCTELETPLSSRPTRCERYGREPLSSRSETPATAKSPPRLTRSPGMRSPPTAQRADRQAPGRRLEGAHSCRSAVPAAAIR